MNGGREGRRVESARKKGWVNRKEEERKNGEFGEKEEVKDSKLFPSYLFT